MKNLFLLIILVSFSTLGFSQKAASFKEEAQNLTAPLITKYSLDKYQGIKMAKIQERKLKNTSDIQIYRNTDDVMYYKKKKSIQEGTDFSIRRMLDKSQLKIYEKEMADLRTRRANTQKILMEKGVKGFELEKALIDIE